MRERLLIWLAVTGWWLVMGLVWSTQFITMAAAEGRAVDARHILAGEMTSALLWVPISMALLWQVRRRPIERGDAGPATAWLMLAVLGVVVARAATVVLL